MPDLVFHALTDGRDTSPTGGPAYLEEVSRWLKSAGRFGTVGGRYYGMDRDHRWERTKLAYDAIVHAEGPHADDPVAAVRASHEAGETDEFVKPTVIGDHDGVADGDVIISFNFRADRMRQIFETLVVPGFDAFERGAGAFDVTTMTQYRHGWDYPIAFPPREPAATMAETISEAGGHQLHVAETEKYAHVTYFFNGGREDEWEGEERKLVDSPRDVPTYDFKPEMSAAAAAGAFCDAWESEAATATGSGSSTSPTRTWSGTPATSPPRPGRSRRSTPVSPRSSRPSMPAAAPADHRRPRQRRLHAQPRRHAQHRAHDEPRAADRDRRGNRARLGRASSPTSHRPHWRSSGSPSPMR